jgi:hypothetical protein
MFFEYFANFIAMLIIDRNVHQNFPDMSKNYFYWPVIDLDAVGEQNTAAENNFQCMELIHSIIVEHMLKYNLVSCRLVTMLGFLAETERHANALIVTMTRRIGGFIDFEFSRYEPWGEKGNFYAAHSLFQRFCDKVLNPRLHKLSGDLYQLGDLGELKEMLIYCPGPQTKYRCEDMWNKRKDLFWANGSWGFCTVYALFYIYMRVRKSTEHYDDDELARILAEPDNTQLVCQQFGQFIEWIMRKGHSYKSTLALEEIKEKRRKSIGKRKRSVTRSISKNRRKSAIQKKRRRTLGTKRR